MLFIIVVRIYALLLLRRTTSKFYGTLRTDVSSLELIFHLEKTDASLPELIFRSEETDVSSLELIFHLEKTVDLRSVWK